MHNLFWGILLLQPCCDGLEMPIPPMPAGEEEQGHSVPQEALMLGTSVPCSGGPGTESCVE